jgi:hypothetical protein
METWKHRHRDMDMEIWTWRHEHGDMDMKTWTSRHRHGDMELKYWGILTFHEKNKMENGNPGNFS